MPVIYYSYYESEGLSIQEASALEHRLGCALLAYGLFRQYGLSSGPAVTDTQPVPDENGKPYLPDHPEVCFNITHCSGLAACVFCDRPIGIDAELPGYFAEVLINRALSEPEKTCLQAAGTDIPLKQEIFWRFWTLKEAYVKCSGVGVDADLTAVSFTLPQDTGSRSADILCSDASVSCYQTTLSHGQILSLCSESPTMDKPLIYHIVF